MCFRNAMINEHVIFLLLVICFWLLLLVLLCFSLLCRLFRKKHSYLVVVFKPLSQRSCCCVHYLPPLGCPSSLVLSLPGSRFRTVSGSPQHSFCLSHLLPYSSYSSFYLSFSRLLPISPPNNLRVRM